MRNLKRALSLAMASIMLLGMMVMGASAVSYNDFSDKDKIVNTEAVNTMVSLGVLAGRDTGDFDPTGVVTRAEMAKIIAVTLNGGKDPTLGNATSSFTDAKGHWAEGFIAYCANLGILNGYGDGTVKPNGTVTGTEAAKMVLTALGYRSDIEKLTGANWSLNTDVLANKIGLYDGLSINPNEGLTRDSTAQLIYNGVQADEVTYRNNYGEYSGVIYAQPVNGVNNDSSVLWTRFKVQKVEGVVVANEIFSVDGGAKTLAGKTRLTDIYFNGDLYQDNAGRGMSVTYPVAIDNDLMGHRVVLYVKGLKDLSPNATTMEVVGTPILSDKNLIAETTGKLTTSAKVETFLNDNGMAIGTANANAHGVLNASSTGSAFTAGVPTLTAGINEKPGRVVTFIDHNGDGAVDYIMTELAKMAKVTVYNESGKKLTVAGIGSVDFKNIGDPEAVSLNDIVLYVKYGDTYYMEKAETVSGKFESYNASSEKLKLDGTDYGISAVQVDNSSAPTLETYTANPDLVGDTYTLYLDGYGNAVAQEMNEEAIGNYALVVNSAGTVSGATSVIDKGEVRLIQADGTTATYNVNLLASANKFGLTGSSSTVKERKMAQLLKGDNINADGYTSANVMENMAVTYVVGADGKVVLGNPNKLNNYVSVNTGVTAPSADVVQRSTTRYTFTKDAAGAAANTTVTVNDSTIFFFVDATGNTADPRVVVGASKLPTAPVKKDGNVNATTISAVYDKRTGTTQLAKVLVVDAQFVGVSNYLYVSDDHISTRNDNGETVYTYPVVFDSGEKGTIDTKDTYSSGKVYEYTMDGKFATLSVKQNQVLNGTYNGYFTTFARGNAITIEWGREKGIASKSLTLANNVKVVNVEDGSNPYTTSISDGQTVALATDNDGLVKVIFVKDGNTEYRTVKNTTGAAITYERLAADDSTKSYITLNSGASIEVASGFSFKTVTNSSDTRGAMLYTTIGDNGDRINETSKSGTTLTNGGYLASLTVPDYANVEVTYVKSGAVVPPTPGTTTATFAGQLGAKGGNWELYLNTGVAYAGYTEKRGTFEITPASTDTLYIRNTTWNQGEHYTVGTLGAYTVDSTKSIAIPGSAIAAAVTIDETSFTQVFKVSLNNSITATGTGSVAGTNAIYVPNNTVVTLGLPSGVASAISVTSSTAKTAAAAAGATITVTADVWVYGAASVTNAGTNAGKVYSDADCTAEITSGHYVAMGTTVYVQAFDANDTVAATATTTGTVATLNAITAVGGKTTYSYVMNAVDVTFTNTDVA